MLNQDTPEFADSVRPISDRSNLSACYVIQLLSESGYWRDLPSLYDFYPTAHEKASALCSCYGGQYRVVGREDVVHAVFSGLVRNHV